MPEGQSGRLMCDAWRMQVLDEIVSRGGAPEFIRVLSITVAPPALKKLSEKYPGEESCASATELPPLLTDARR